MRDEHLKCWFHLETWRKSGTYFFSLKSAAYLFVASRSSKQLKIYSDEKVFVNSDNAPAHQEEVLSHKYFSSSLQRHTCLRPPPSALLLVETVTFCRHFRVGEKLLEIKHFSWQNHNFLPIHHRYVFFTNGMNLNCKSLSIIT